MTENWVLRSPEEASDKADKDRRCHIMKEEFWGKGGQMILECVIVVQGEVLSVYKKDLGKTGLISLKISLIPGGRYMGGRNANLLTEARDV